MITGTRIALARKAAGLTQQQMADMIGVHMQTLGAWERAGDSPIAAKDQEAGEALEMMMTAMEQMEAIKTADLANPAHCVPSPFDFWFYVSRGDLLILSQSRAIDGDIIIAYANDGQPEWMGRVMHATQDPASPLVAHDQRAHTHRLPPRDRYRVIDLAVHRHRDRRADYKCPDDIPPEAVYFPADDPVDDFGFGDD